MPVTITRGSAIYGLPKLSEQIPQAPPQLRQTDIFGTAKDSKADNPLSASFFVMEKTDMPIPTPVYTYDEAGYVIKGVFVITDETGNTATINEGDVFFVARGSRISFSTPSYCVAWKVFSRWKRE